MKKAKDRTGENLPAARFVDTHFVDETYHYQHSQLIHKHNHVLELFYVHQGQGRYIVGGREYALQPGHLVICNAGTLHGEAPFQEESMRSYCCVLDGLSLPGLPPNCLVENTHRPVLFFPPGTAMEQTMLALHELHEASEENWAVCNHLANAILGMVCLYMWRDHVNEEKTEQKTEDLIRAVTEYLDEHFAQTITLEELGKEFHISHYYLAHIFKTETGLSPMKYVIHRRIGEAQNLLMNTSSPIYEISERLGFGSNCHMSSMFKKYVGLSPSAYRQHFQTSQKNRD